MLVTPREFGARSLCQKDKLQNHFGGNFCAYDVALRLSQLDFWAGA